MVIDRDGLPALTMRAVARELGMATMSLYHYVRDKDELAALVVDQVLATVDLAVPPGDWRERLTMLLDRVRDPVLTHPATVPLLLRHRHSAPASRRMIEAALGVLTDAGFAGPSGWSPGTRWSRTCSARCGTRTSARCPAEEFPLLAAVLRGLGSGAGAREVLDVNGI